MTIYPPYSLEDCKNSSSTKAFNTLNHVKKLVSIGIYGVKHTQKNGHVGKVKGF